MDKKKLKISRNYHREMHEHYLELFEVVVKELRFSRMQTDHNNFILSEVQELLSKGCNPKLIEKVIELGKSIAVLDISIHNDFLFNQKKGSK